MKLPKNTTEQLARSQYKGEGDANHTRSDNGTFGGATKYRRISANLSFIKDVKETITAFHQVKNVKKPVSKVRITKLDMSSLYVAQFALFFAPEKKCL